MQKFECQQCGAKLKSWEINKFELRELKALSFAAPLASVALCDACAAQFRATPPRLIMPDPKPQKENNAKQKPKSKRGRPRTKK